MADIFGPTRTAPERVLVYGPEKAGKSSLWFDVIRWAVKYGYNGRFYVIDTDRTWDKMADAEFPGSEGELFTYRFVDEIAAKEPMPESMVVVYQPFDMAEALQVSREVSRVAHRNDWTILDMMDWAWAEAEAYYIDQVFGEEPANYFLQVQAEIKAAKDAGAKGHKKDFGGQEGKDWGFITKVYKRFELPLTIKSRNHVFMVSGEKQLDANRGASPEQIKLYKPANGWAAAGQKGIGHRCDTLLRMGKRTSGQRELTMVGDRGREDLWGETIGGRTLKIDEPPNAFVRRYLVELGGWERPSRRGRGSSSSGGGRGNSGRGSSGRGSSGRSRGRSRGRSST